ncbi:hypothetical protein [Vannielia litorea]|uniref:Uncharacterized protein n=1 Tax=Vannielia litorea TaxID=1217970 RepID=A0A1N6IEH2_9RHOB|nr:hypothetical protein [Vannielia litorea]SIO30413.1 hypothetical protein SAMN05444002_3773 [Vannielia litorea]
MSFLPGMGLQMEVFSGGQPTAGNGPRVGSVRHDHGNAADVFFRQNGQRLDWANPQHVPIFQDVVRQAKAAGLTGFGAGPGYMQPGSMHIGYGTPAVWGAGGRGANAPDWLREAYGMAPTGPGLSFGPNVPSPATGLGSPLADMFSPEMMSMGVPVVMAEARETPGERLRKQAETRAEEDRKRREALFGGGLFG